MERSFGGFRLGRDLLLLAQVVTIGLERIVTWVLHFYLDRRTDALAPLWVARFVPCRFPAPEGILALRPVSIFLRDGRFVLPAINRAEGCHVDVGIIGNGARP